MPLDTLPEVTDNHTNARDQLVLYVLREPGYLEQVVKAFTSAGLGAIEVIESQSAAEVIDDEVPIFASFRHVFTGAHSYNYVILGVADGPSRDDLVAQLDALFAEVEAGQRGVVLAVPLLLAHKVGARDIP